MVNSNNDILLIHAKIVDKLVNIFHFITEYELIFNDHPPTQQIINDTKSTFFTDLYWLYWNYITIRVCALMDNRMTGGNENLTIPKLAHLIGENNFNCTETVNNLVSSILDKLRPFRKVRNKAFAHFDLITMTSSAVLETIQLDDLIIICRLIEDILNEIDKELGNPQKLFGLRSQEGAMRLINILRLGHERKQQIINKNEDL